MLQVQAICSPCSINRTFSKYALGSSLKDNHSSSAGHNFAPLLCFSLKITFNVLFLSPAYQTLQEASRPRDYDEDLSHQLNDNGYLLTFRALVGLENGNFTFI